jgi:hypothetical protein
MPGTKPATHQLKMTNTQGEPQAAQLLKLLHEFKSSSVRIDVRPFTTLLKGQELVMGKPTGSDERIGHASCRSFTMTTPCLTLLFSHSSFCQNTKWLSSPPTVLSWFGTLRLLPTSKTEIEAERTPVWYQWGDPSQIAESGWHSNRKDFQEALKMEKVRPVSTCGRKLLRGWWRPIGLMVSFMILTASVQNTLNTTTYSLRGKQFVSRWEKGIFLPKTPNRGYLVHTQLPPVSTGALSRN